MSTKSALRADLDAEDRKILAEDRKRINDRPRYCGKVDQRPRRGGAWLLAARARQAIACGRPVLVPHRPIVLSQPIVEALLVDRPPARPNLPRSRRNTFSSVCKSGLRPLRSA